MLAEMDSAGNYGNYGYSPVRMHRAAGDASTWQAGDPAGPSCPVCGLACNHSAPDHAFRDGVARTERVASHAEINQWAEGTCARCGTQTLVTGRKLCVYCDQLRVMPPLPPEQRRRAAAPARLALPPAAFLVLTCVAVAVIIIYLLMLR